MRTMTGMRSPMVAEPYTMREAGNVIATTTAPHPQSGRALGRDTDMARLLGAIVVTGASTANLVPLLPPAGVLALACMTVDQVADELGCSKAGAQRLVLAFALHRRLLAALAPERPTCSVPDEVAAFLRPHALRDVEALWVLPLDPRCRLIGGEPIEVFRGDVDGTDAGPRAICRAALRAGAASVVVAHNHPSGDPTPSAADVAVTRRIAAACRSVDVPLVDHLIVTADGRWCSLRRDDPELFC